jgi:protein CpxP
MKKLALICCLFIGLIATATAQTTTDPVQKAKGLQKQLKLSDNQTSKVAAIYTESAKKFDKIKVDEHGNTNKMLVAVGPLRTATIKKIKAILTARQAAKYDVLVKESKNSSLNGGWSDGWGSTAS